eukprot:gnl/Dysnectes_brevis/3268_a4090_826.p1 GENE.gnl/Dysnectes_brevis/3268_a4090_826~~gnl/Dysnectes_brevis/3268_a4090_826.p1  ORF type:complete len:285 (-),score=36.25 gnl/Dysnectes_brevis/3268_a4090_826:27-881(-)
MGRSRRKKKSYDCSFMSPLVADASEDSIERIDQVNDQFVKIKGHSFFKSITTSLKRSIPNIYESSPQYHHISSLNCSILGLGTSFGQRPSRSPILQLALSFAVIDALLTTIPQSPHTTDLSLTLSACDPAFGRADETLLGRHHISTVELDECRLKELPSQDTLQVIIMPHVPLHLCANALIPFLTQKDHGLTQPLIYLGNDIEAACSSAEEAFAYSKSSDPSDYKVLNYRAAQRLRPLLSSLLFERVWRAREPGREPPLLRGVSRALHGLAAYVLQGEPGKTDQ